MAKVLLENAEPIPTADYKASIQKIEFSKSKNPDWPDQFRWTFRIEGGEYDGREICAWCSMGEKRSTKTKFYEWVSAILPNVQLGTEIDTDELIGQLVKITVVVAKKDNVEFNKITGLRPLKGK